MPLWVRWRVKLVGIDVEGLSTLAELVHQFQTGKVRLMLAFRHPTTNDPYCMADLLWQQIPRAARQKGLPLNDLVHTHFIYDRGIPLWAGKFVGWFYSHLGGTPIRRGKVDRAGLRSVRELFANGRFPMAAAPEGATNGHNEIMSPIEPGIAQFGFWCAEDLFKADRTEQVLIVPLGLRYHFVTPPWKNLARLLDQLEQETGLTNQGWENSEAATVLAEAIAQGIPLTGEQETLLYRRLWRLSERLLTLMEDFYNRFYSQKLPPSKPLAPLPNLSADPEPSTVLRANQQLSERLQALLQAALTVAEQSFDLPPTGTVTDRCRRLEQAGWERIYREDLQLETLSPVEQGLADRVAEDASLRIWHMRLVETFVSVTGRYVIEKPTVERFADTLLLMWDAVARLKGDVPFPRPILGPQRATFTVGTPISVSDRWDTYKGNRRQAVSQLTQDLQTALEKMLHS